ncbi:uncharacterized protein JCM15063_001389 [Sporobolomyces koalae]|uniref:uncharacterized protein n=1 Tax=Sporobolomyces koalae TaxID=500713 RepID=UPI003170B37F
MSTAAGPVPAVAVEPFDSTSAQARSDSDYCQVIPTATVPTSSSIQRARSGSRTYSEVQAEERELARRRTHSRERGERPLEDDAATRDGLSYTELKQEMETLLSLRRRSLSQPLTVDPDLPPTAPAASSPPLSSSSSSSLSPPSSSTGGPNRPKLSLTISTSHLQQHPTGGPISPTAPSPAETGTLVRRKSSVAPKLPSEHPLPALPTVPSIPPLTSPISTSHFSSSSSSASSPISPTSSSEHCLSPSYGTNTTTPTPSIIRTPAESSSSPTTTPRDEDDVETNQARPTQDLFWLPASLHPELAPQEFKAFIREQTRPEALARRTSLGNNNTSSPSGTRGLRVGPTRRNSMLRGEYKPRANDGVESSDEHSTVSRRSSTRTSSSSMPGGGGVLAFEELTIRDLQRLEHLAAKAEREQELQEGEGEGERLGRVLRRSLSLNPHRMAQAVVGTQYGAASDWDNQDHKNPLSTSLPASYGSTLNSSASSVTSNSTTLERSSSLTTDEDYDSPLIVPPPGQILRRNARTKIRKTGPGGEVSFGGGYRHGSTGGAGSSRLGGSARRARTSSDGSVLSTTSASSASGGVGTSTAPFGSTSGTNPGFEEDRGDGTSSESHEFGTNELRNSVSSLGSIDTEPSRPSTTHVVPTLTMPPFESPPLDGTAQYLEIATEPAQPQVDQPLSDSRHRNVTRDSEGSQSLPPAMNPASAEYDWASQNLVPSPPSPPTVPKLAQPVSPSPPVTPPQYAVHPAHSKSGSAPPPPQAVPIPVPERERSNSLSSVSSRSSNTTSTTSGEGKEKEKKMGWAAKLGLGGSSHSDDKKRRGKGKDKDKDHARGENEKSETVMVETTSLASSPGGGHSKSGKDREGGSTSTSLFGGLFGRKRNDYDSQNHSNSSSNSGNSNSAGGSTASAIAPPPPPTASGALLPNGRYANFYRLPIHVERAIYRLSHIKLANPRRPLYEQVLISNLMFWYLGLIQKPQPPPPAAPPVPIPGKRQSSPSPSSSRTTNPNKASVPASSTVPSPVAGQYVNTAELQRAGSPASQASGYTPLASGPEPRQNSRIHDEDEEDDDDDRPLAQSTRRNSHGETFSSGNSPSSVRTIPVVTNMVPESNTSAGFQVTSRRLTPPPPPAPPVVPSRSTSPPTSPTKHLMTHQPNTSRDENGDLVDDRNRRISVLSNKSLNEIYEAYSIGDSSGGGGGSSTPTLPTRGSSLPSSTD